MSMFSSAFKSISATNITGNYSISQDVTSTAGPWRIHDAKKKSTGKQYSVFVFDRRSIDGHSSGLSRSSSSAFKRTADEIVERLRKEASSLAKLRHPNILELVEPVEDTRGGGLQFVTEAVTASLAGLLAEKDDRERHGGVGGRGSRYVVEEADGTRRRREVEIDELEIQKGLLQISKALEFLHENAGLVHGNLTPDAVLVNGKSDWKISGLSFCSPAEGSDKPTSIQGVSLSEVLNMDSRLPRTVQLNVDYSSPDFVIDNNLNSSADMFSLGLLCIALYNSPHKSPLETHGSTSTYRRIFSSSSTVPHGSNKFFCKGNLPREFLEHVLPRLITRRPAQRLTAKQFQESEIFNNVQVSTIRFLDSFPAKTPGEKTAFLRGLGKVLPSFPKSVLEKKLLPALLDEMKDRDLISLILQNAFKMVELLPSAKKVFSEKVRPALKEIFVTNVKGGGGQAAQGQAQEKDAARDAGLMVFLENIKSSADNCSGKEFKDDILPVIFTAIESPTHGIVDVALRGLPVILPVLDFSTIKNELFPVIAAMFARTNSLQIKIRGLRAFVILCGGTTDPSMGDDGLDGFGPERKKPSSSSSALDKYTMQEKIIPLLKVIRTKEPAVMMAVLDVLRVVGEIADAEFVALDMLPICWNMALGPLLNLKQFEAFTELIKRLSRKVEEEQTRKLQELSASHDASVSTIQPLDDFMSFGQTSTSVQGHTNGSEDGDFERLVRGKTSSDGAFGSRGWDDANSSSLSGALSPGLATHKSSRDNTPRAPTFSWSTPSPISPTSTPAPQASAFGNVASGAGFRTVTPDLGSIGALTPSSTQFSRPLQPTTATSAFSPPPPSQSQSQPQTASVNWGKGAPATSNPWGSSSGSSTAGFTMNMGNLSVGQQQQQQQQQQQKSTLGSAASSFSLPPPPGVSSSTPTLGPSSNAFGGSGMGMGVPPPPSASNSTGNALSSQPSSGLGGTNPRGVAGGGGGQTLASLTSKSQQQSQGQSQGQASSGSGLAKYQSLL